MIVADALLMVLGFTALVFSSVNDIKTREVPDWLSYGLIVSCFGVRIFHALIFSDLWYLLDGLIGFGIMLILGLVMYYTKQWGGGDAKLVMGLGIAFSSNLFNWNNFLIGFLINVLIFGALYGLGWSIYLAFKNRKDFVKSFVKNFNERRRIRIFSLGFGLLIILSIFFIHIPYVRFILCVTTLALVGYVYLHVFMKAVEDSCMYKWLPVSKLTEGDWVAQPVYVKGKLLCGPKDLGLEKHQIIALKKANVKKVFVKEGIPFVPSFLIASVVTFVWGNVLFSFI
jgi:Flp pilus assembly protein protease CpaA